MSDELTTLRAENEQLRADYESFVRRSNAVAEQQCEENDRLLKDNARLRAAIVEAPHWDNCKALNEYRYYPCTCWKQAALAGCVTL